MLGVVCSPCLALSDECADIHDRDVAAGIAILLEAGGLVTTANPPEDPEVAPIEEVRLGSRLYLAIRYVDFNLLRGLD